MGIREENHQQFLKDMADQNIQMNAKPLAAMIGLTNVCNLQCVFCPYCGVCTKKIKKKQEISKENLEKFSTLFPTAEFLNPSFRGEPFLYSHFDEFIEYCRQGDVLSKTHLTNNATQLHRYDLRKIEGVNIVSVFFDGADKETFEMLRVGANFDKVLSNMGKLRRELPNTVLQVTVVVCRLNLHQLADIYSIARDKGFNYIAFNTIFGPDNDKVIDLLRLRESDRPLLDKQMREVERRNSDKKMAVMNVTTFDDFEDGVVLDYQNIVEELKKLREQEPYLDFDEERDISQPSRRVHTECKCSTLLDKPRLPYCTGPWHIMSVMPDGKIAPCCASFGSIGSISDSEQMKDIWNSKNYQELRQSMFDWGMLPEYCKSCNVFSRYDYIGEYIDYLKNLGVDMADVEIPPNFYPNRDMIKDDLLWRRICEKQRKEEIAKLGSVNSEEYWENRFKSNDWEKYDGEGQSAFFSKLALKAFPEWLKRDLTKASWSVHDLGCAEGAGTAELARYFPNCHFTGVDFSKSAIEKASEKHPFCDFVVGDITGEIEKADIIFCSNVLEHMKHPRIVLENMIKAAKRHAIFLIPLHDDTDIEEHFFVFSEEFIPAFYDNYVLSNFAVMNCDEMETAFWPGKQLFFVYTEKALYYSSDHRLSDIYCADGYLSAVERIKGLKEELHQLQEQINCDKENLNSSILSLQAENRELQNENQELCERVKKQQDSVYKEICDLEKNIESLEACIQQLTNDKNALITKQQAAIAQVNAMATSKMFKLVHLVNRTFKQGFHSDKAERKQFRRWLCSRKNHTPDNDHRYNPLFSVLGILNGEIDYSNMDLPYSNNGNDAKPSGRFDVNDVNRVSNILKSQNTKADIIILGVIDYGFRHQRPQHFAERFSANGHRVFYVNANFAQNTNYKQLKSNLLEVTFANLENGAIYSTDWSDQTSEMVENVRKLVNDWCIRDAIVIVDYPNWIYVAEHLRNFYGFRMITDYMDDFTGFLNPAENLIKENCYKLLDKCDSVVASSQFLCDIAAKYKDNVEVIRNGTEYAYFHQAYEQVKSTTGHKVIGYYGAIAEWFNIDVIKRCAQRFTDCDIILVGNVTANRSELEQYPNIQLVGEVPYTGLLEWLKRFDVCLIPFDTSTDLIKATNPVKFYEYLSAGKKVVATGIPELLPYKDQYVYLENDPDAFCDKVELCLSGNDTLANVEECFKFAQENDWNMRAERFMKAALSIYPKISVIVLCYNQLEYTKQCVRSVLEQTAYPNYELVIVDNNSTDGTVNYLKQIASENVNVKIVLNQDNRGFAGGNNDGIAVSDGDYIVLLNNDTIVTRGWLTGLLKHYSNDSKAGIVGPITNSIGNEAKINVPYTDVASMPLFAYQYTTEHMGEEFPHSGILAMFCVMISRKIYDEVGPLDEGYGIGMFEDDDYSMAVTSKGYSLIMAEDVFIHHYGTVSFKKLENEEYKKIFDTNKEYFEKKWKSPWKMPYYRDGVS